MQTQMIVDHSMEVKIRGEVLTELPQNLYIPPDALRVFLDLFQGPLDLLLYLIKKQNLDILDIPIVEITHQYVQYVELMSEMHFDLASEYLLMAAMLAEIKSRMLLPRVEVDESGEMIDPRAELVRRLQEYERYKKAAEQLNELPRLDRENFLAQVLTPPLKANIAPPPVEMDQLLAALRDVWERARLYGKHQILREPLSIRERMSIVLQKIKSDEFTAFTDMFTAEEGRMGIVVTLIAVLELIRQAAIELVQSEAFAPIYVRAAHRHPRESGDLSSHE